MANDANLEFSNSHPSVMPETIRLIVTSADAGPDLWDGGVALVSAIVGAIAGAVPAFMLAKRSSKEILRRDQQARREQHRMLALRTHVKLGIILNSIAVVKRQIDAAFADPPAIGAEPWQTVEPVVGAGREYEIDFDIDEMAVMLSIKRGDLADQLSLLARRHTVHGETLKEYAVRRERLRESMPAPSAVNGHTGTTELTRQQMLTVRPQMVALNSLITQLRTFLAADLLLAIALADELPAVIRSELGVADFPGFTIPDEIRANSTDGERVDATEPVAPQ